MFDVSDVGSSSFHEDDWTPVPAVYPNRTKKHSTVANTSRMLAVEFSKSAKRVAIEKMLAHYDHENATLRTPCKKCNNLVKPSLMKQHNAAYHS